ncbi:MAG: hypothetical protein JNL70_26825 [Saprospiraceae bacterium]|nr:hypothetical protein [Saprospiraceae bacterium]
MFNQDNQSFRMRRGMGFAIVAVGGVLVVGGVVMYLWNAILPSAIHVEVLSYWQAVGLLILCRILFGNWGGRHRGGGKPPFAGKSAMWREKWMNMSDEERAQFKEQWKKRCQSRD